MPGHPFALTTVKGKVLTGFAVAAVVMWFVTSCQAAAQFAEEDKTDAATNPTPAWTYTLVMTSLSALALTVVIMCGAISIYATVAQQRAEENPEVKHMREKEEQAKANARKAARYTRRAKSDEELITTNQQRTKEQNKVDRARSVVNRKTINTAEAEVVTREEVGGRGGGAKLSGSLDEASSLDSIGDALESQGNLKGALEHDRRDLAITQAKAPGSLDEASALNDIGSALRSQGDLDGALEHHHRALAIFQAKAPGSLDEASALDSIGDALESQGNLKGALEHHRRALAIFQAKAPGSLDEASALNNIGYVLEEQGDLTAQRKTTKMP